MTTSLPAKPARRVLILGANGRFGLAAAQAFASAGWEVLAQVRRAPTAGMPARVQPVERPLDDLDGIAAIAAGAEVVVHAVNPSDYTRWAAELLPLGRLAMDIAERLGARLVLPGNVYTYGSTMPARLGDDTPHRPDTRKGRLRLRVEDELRERAPRLRHLVLRAGDFFGTGGGVWFDQVITKDIAHGRLAYPGPRDVMHAWAWLPDMARALVGLCERADLPDHLELPFEGYTLTGDRLMDALERCARDVGIGGERPFRRAGVPWPLFRAMAWVLPLWREILEMRYLWQVPHGLDGGPLARWLPAYRPTPLPLALRASLMELGLAAPAHA